MNLSYTIGDKHFDKDGVDYMDATIAASTIEELIELRLNSHNSIGNTIYQVDFDKQKKVVRCYGLNGGTPCLMALIVDTLGCYFSHPLYPAVKAASDLKSVSNVVNPKP